jgi:hypothetical protein
LTDAINSLQKATGIDVKADAEKLALVSRK